MPRRQQDINLSNVPFYPEGGNDLTIKQSKCIFRSHHPTVPDGYYHSVYFEALDIISVSNEAKFEQPSFEAFLKFESVLLQSVNNDGIDDGVVSFIKKTYSADLDTD